MQLTVSTLAKVPTAVVARVRVTTSPSASFLAGGALVGRRGAAKAPTAGAREGAGWRRLFSAHAEGRPGRPGRPGAAAEPEPPKWTEEEVKAGIDKWQAHEKKAPVLPVSEQVRTLVDGGRNGVVSAFSVQEDTKGYPFGQVTSFASDDMGRPVFALSTTLSPQWKNLSADGRCSLAVLSGEFQSLADARLNMIGEASPVPPEEIAAVREAFRAKHPNAYYIDFGDFSFLRMDRIVEVRYVGGFGRVGKCSGEEYLAASADPVAGFTGPVAGHMNADHAESISAMLTNAIGAEVTGAEIVAIDRLGMDCRGSLYGEVMKMRLPFPREAATRGDLKTLIVEMTKAAAA